MIFIFPVLLLLSFSAGKEEIKSSKVLNTIFYYENNDNRIIGGHEVERNAYPFMARISTLWKKSGKRFLCGGTLIHEEYVLTAAHCVIDLKTNDIFESVTVFLGDHDRLSYDMSEIEMDVVEVIIHENYYQKGSSDLALLRFSPVQTNTAIQATCISSFGKEFIGYNGTVLGWGLTSTLSDIPSEYLKEATVPIWKDYRCNIVPKYDPSEMMCTGFLGKNGEDTVYKGDSGGPLLIRDGEGKVIVVGVAAFVSLKGGSIPLVTAGIFTKISAYSKWIEQHTGLNKNICFHP